MPDRVTAGDVADTFEETFSKFLRKNPQAATELLGRLNAGAEGNRGGYRPDAVAPGRSRTEPPDGSERHARFDGARADAMRAIEANGDAIGSTASDRLVELVERDAKGIDAEYIAAVADPAYERAFAKCLRSRGGAQQTLDPEEAAALERVGGAMDMRSMVTGEGADGGFAVPYQLDPTINLISDGALNPIRKLATISQITVSEWRGITSEGTEATFVPEATEASDDSPTLAQPTIRPERAQCFVPFSIELGMDWTGLREELGRLFADAKDVLEADKFAHGAGEGANEPEGLIAGLHPSSVVGTAAVDTFAVDDVYGLQEQVPPRFQPRASWLSSLTIANEIHRFSGPGSEEPKLFNDDRTTLLSKPWSEVSVMSTDSGTGGEDILLYGDVGAGYRIVDRVGLTVELVAHLFGENRRPTGQRGLFAYWRTAGQVLVDNAVRLLEVTPAS